MSSKSKREIASEEYYFLQGEIGRFDSITHQIKNWSITVSFALLVAAFTQKTSAGFLLVTGASLLFWMTEARWKRYQHIHLIRLKEVEDFLLGDGDEYVGPAIHKRFRERLGPWKQAVSEEWTTAWLKNVKLPHDIIALSGVVLFLLYQFSFLEFPAEITK